jgi:hypothetical protein
VQQVGAVREFRTRSSHGTASNHANNITIPVAFGVTIHAMDFEDVADTFRPGPDYQLYRSLRDSRQVEAVRALARLRGRRQGYLKALHVWLQVPHCGPCYEERAPGGFNVR